MTEQTLPLPEPNSVLLINGESERFPDSSAIPVLGGARFFALTSERPTPPAQLVEGLHKGWLNFAVWNGHEFEVLPMALEKVSRPSGFKTYVNYYDTRSGGYRGHSAIRRAQHPTEFVMRIFYPIDPRIRVVDVQGAKKAYPNETNNGWLFAHTDEGTHHDYELGLLAAVDGVFQPLFRQYEVDEKQSTGEPARERAKDRFILLAAFYGDTVAQARTKARSVYLGYRQQQPHPAVGYLDADITAAIEAVRVKWAETKSADLAKIQSAITYLNSVLTIPTPETRWEQAARLERERKEAEAAAAAESESQGGNGAGDQSQGA